MNKNSAGVILIDDFFADLFPYNSVLADEFICSAKSQALQLMCKVSDFNSL